MFQHTLGKGKENGFLSWKSRKEKEREREEKIKTKMESKPQKDKLRESQQHRLLWKKMAHLIPHKKPRLQENCADDVGNNACFVIENELPLFSVGG